MLRDLNEVHNNTGSMTLSRFNQEGGRVTGNIHDFRTESRQNVSTTTGSRSGVSIGLSTAAIPTSVNVNASSTNGSRAWVDEQSTFIVGEGSDLHIGSAENIGAVIGKEDDSRLRIERYRGKDIVNHDTMETTGGSLGLQAGNVPLSNIGYSHIIGKVEGRQRETGTEQKGLESTGQATNHWFTEKYRDNDRGISIASDGRDYSDVDFGEHVGMYLQKTLKKVLILKHFQ